MTAWPHLKLIVVWAVGGAISFQGWGIVAGFHPALGHATTVLGWLLVPFGTYRVLRSYGYKLGVGSLLVLLSGWLVGWLASTQGFDSDNPVGAALGVFVAGVVIGFTSSVVLLGRHVFTGLAVAVCWAVLFCVASVIAVYGTYSGMLLYPLLGAMAGQVAALILVGGLLGAAVGAAGNALLAACVVALDLLPSNSGGPAVQ